MFNNHHRIFNGTEQHPPEAIGNKLGRRGREAGCGLVEEVELLRSEEYHREGEGLALASGEGAGALVETRLQEVEEVEHFGSGLGVDGAGEGETCEGEVFVDRLAREDVVGLTEIADAVEDALLGRERGYRTALKADVACREREHADDGLEERRLAAAVRARDQHRLAFLHREIHVVQDRPVAVAAGEMGNGQEFAHADSPFARDFLDFADNDCRSFCEPSRSGRSAL